MCRLHVHEGEAGNGDQIPEERASWAVTITSQNREHPGEEILRQAERRKQHATLADLGTVGETIGGLRHALIAQLGGHLTIGAHHRPMSICIITQASCTLIA